MDENNENIEKEKIGKEKIKKFVSDFIIAHQDADGLLSSVLLTKILENPQSYRPQSYRSTKILFASPYSLKKTILSLLLKLNNNVEKINLWILDIAPEQKTVLISSLFKKAIWIDHHERNKIEIKPRNVKIFVQHLPSCFSVLRNYFEKYSGKILRKEFFSEISKEEAEQIKQINEIADEIDTNSVKSKMAEIVRDYLGWLKWKYKGIVLKLEMQKLARDLAENGLIIFKKEEIEKNAKEYKNFLEEKWKELENKLEIREINKFRVAFLFSDEEFPIYYVFNKIKEKEKKDEKEKIDILVFAIKKKGIKFELRSFNDFDTLIIAKHFGGGGHKKASGGMTMLNENNFKEKIEKILSSF